MTQTTLLAGPAHPVRGRTRRFCEGAASVVAAAAFLVTLAATLGGVAARYFGLSGGEWTFEIAGIAFLWTTFFGVLVAELKGENVAFTAFFDRLRGHSRRIVVLFLGLATIWFAAELFTSGLAYIERSGMTPTPVLRLPRAVSIVPLLVAAAGTGLIAPAAIVDNFRKHRSSGPEGDGE